VVEQEACKEKQISIQNSQQHIQQVPLAQMAGSFHGILF
jgi:hypothetical protein